MTRVLIVDDKEDNLYYLRALLTGHGCTVETARHGAEALVLARNGPPDLVVSDLLMPVMDGYTLLRHWKSDARLKSIPFIVYTATYTEAEDERLALNLGADAFVLKPAEPEDFLARIRDVQTNAAANVPEGPKTPVGDEKELLKVYSETLIRKLEEKTLQLEESNRALQHDIIERKAAEVLLRESELRFRQLAENINEVFWLIDPAKKQMLYVSPAYEKIWGRTCEELYAKPATWMESIHRDDREGVAHAAATKQAQGHYDETYRILRPDGTVCWIRDRAFPIKNEAGQIYRIVGTAEDITERKKLEEQFLRAQRMESIGTLAGGIAHDLNNLLSPIVMGVGLLKLTLTDEGALRVIDAIERNAYRGSDLVKQVLSFARGVEGARVSVQLRHIVREVESIACNTFPRNITFHSQVPPDTWPVTGDPTQLNQVLLNLCVNARDAMPDGGDLTITGRNVVIDEQYAATDHALPPGPYVVLEVADTGTGMKKEVMDRIFEPFFTTKEIGKGTGLGLSTVLGIVRSHGGSVHVESEPGQGSKFVIHLPAQASDHGAPPALAHEPARVPGGQGEVILVVDDDASVLDITRQTLEAFGYRVLCAVDGADAMSVFALNRAEIAVVLTDIMMPVMDGIALISALHRIDPRVKIIAASGLAGNEARAASVGVKHFLAKPYTADAMLATLREVLASP